MMGLYRADPKDGAAWITGASTGIGRSLALQLASEGYTVAATARDAMKLKSLEEEASGLAGRILAFPCDVTERDAMAATLERIEQTAGPVALAVFNAGTYIPVKGDSLSIDKFVDTYRLNIFGVLHGLAPVTERMRARGRGQVALVGSVSGYVGLPMASAYGASKAALTNMAEALKLDFDAMNIRLQIVNPGFVDTPLTRKNKFSMPGLISVERASRRISRGLRQDGFEIAFPRRLAWTLKLAKMLPYPLYFYLAGRVTGLRPSGVTPKKSPR